MKKSGLILALGALVMASCSSDDMLNRVPENGENGSKQLIGFTQRVGNMGRDGDPVGLETFARDFGVWALKGATQGALMTANASITSTSTATNLVMNDYLVGYWNGTNGYKPLNSQYFPTGLTTTDGVWYYEGLGNKDLTGGAYEFVAGATGWTAATSAVDNQFLKYWDQATAFHYFYGYAPYTANVSFGSDGSTNPYLQFENISGGTTSVADDGTVTVNNASADYMYAGVRMASNCNTYVPMAFNRLLSQIRLGFYSTIPGYTVEIAELSTAKKAVVLAPTKVSGTPATYNAGHYNIAGHVKVTFHEANTTDPITATVSYASTTPNTDNIYYPVACLNDATNTKTSVVPVGTSKTDAFLTDLYTVLPSDVSYNDGLTLNITLKFTATDSGEVFYVYGARVFIAPQYAAWKPNNLYTYYFKITPGLSGTTGTPDPLVVYGPDDRTSLIPIVFEDVTIADYVTAGNEHEENLN